MKVKELIKELSKLDQDLDCYVYADHGQTTIPQYHVEECYIIKNDEYYAYEIHPDELNEFESDEIVKVCVISD